VQDVLHSRQVGLPGVVHMQTNLLHGVGDVGSSKRQVLESVCDASELGDVLYRGPRVRSKLHLDVDWSRARLAISHGRMLNNFTACSCVGEETTRLGDARR
jgi:hypothetical protein